MLESKYFKEQFISLLSVDSDNLSFLIYILEMFAEAEN